jgi:hypothetical protein
VHGGPISGVQMPVVDDGSVEEMQSYPSLPHSPLMRSHALPGGVVGWHVSVGLSQYAAGGQPR